eukprot:Anaeramoba_flamelloidesa1071257_248.p1 GENE.a1071257_248~~a1071257_248.p1  ORF type:complete len:100 (-),score=8.77 a1071257_248:41-340(-)
MAKTRIKAKAKKGIVTVKAMAKHPMLSGVEAKKAKKEMNFITHLKAEANGKIVYEVSMSQFLSKNPYIKFMYKGDKGDEVTISWVDLKGNTQTDTKKVK